MTEHTNLDQGERTTEQKIAEFFGSLREKVDELEKNTTPDKNFHVILIGADVTDEGVGFDVTGTLGGEELMMMLMFLIKSQQPNQN